MKPVKKKKKKLKEKKGGGGGKDIFAVLLWPHLLPDQSMLSQAGKRRGLMTYS